MVHVPKLNRRKLNEKATKMIFVGYDSETKGYRCINTSNRKLTISRDIKFLDHLKQPAQKYLDKYETNDSESDEGGDAQKECATPNTTSSSINVSTESSVSDVASTIADTTDNNLSTGVNTDDENGIENDLDNTLVDDDGETTMNSDDPDYIPDQRILTGRQSMINTRLRTISMSKINKL